MVNTSGKSILIRFGIPLAVLVSIALAFGIGGVMAERAGPPAPTPNEVLPRSTQDPITLTLEEEERALAILRQYSPLLAASAGKEFTVTDIGPLTAKDKTRCVH